MGFSDVFNGEQMLLVEFVNCVNWGEEMFFFFVYK